MTAIVPARGASAPVHATSVPGVSGPSSLDLLPASSSTGALGPQEMLLLLIGKLADAQEQLGRNRADETKAHRDLACDQAVEARRKADEAAKEDGVFDVIVESSGLVDVIAMTPGVDRDQAKSIAKDVLKGALVVGALALTMLSAGSTAALCVAAVGVALSYGGQAVASSGVLGQDASKWVGLGMQIAGAVCMTVAGFMGGSSALTRVASLVNGGIGILNGSEQVVQSIHQYSADSHDIDAQRYEMQMKKLEKLIEALIDQLKEDHEIGGKKKEAVQATKQELDQAKLITAQLMRA